MLPVNVFDEQHAARTTPPPPNSAPPRKRAPLTNPAGSPSSVPAYPVPLHACRLFYRTPAISAAPPAGCTRPFGITALVMGGSGPPPSVPFAAGGTVLLSALSYWKLAPAECTSRRALPDISCVSDHSLSQLTASGVEQAMLRPCPKKCTNQKRVPDKPAIPARAVTMPLAWSRRCLGLPKAQIRNVPDNPAIPAKAATMPLAWSGRCSAPAGGARVSPLADYPLEARSLAVCASGNNNINDNHPTVVQPQRSPLLLSADLGSCFH